MSMTVGELVGYIDLDDNGFGATLVQADQDLRRLESTTTRATRNIESEVEAAFAAVAEAIASGADPDEALKDLDRLVAGFSAALDDVEEEARESGQAIGDGIGDGAESGGSRLGAAMRRAIGVLGTVTMAARTTAVAVGLIGAAAAAASLGVVGIAAALGGLLTLGVAVFGGVLAASKEVKAEFAKVGKEALTAFQEAAKPLQGPILEGLGRLQEKIKPFAKMLGEVFEKSAPLIEKAFDVAIDVIDELIEKLPGIVEKGMPIAEFFLSTLGGAITGFIDFVDWGLIKFHAFKAAFSENSTLGAWGAKVREIVSQVKGFFSDVFTSIQEWISENQGTIDGWVEKFKSGFNHLLNAVSSFVDMAKAFWDEFGSTILDTLGGIVSAIVAIWDGLMQALGGIFETFAGIFSGDWERAWGGIKQIGEGIWNGVKGAFEGIWNSLVAIAAKVWELIKEGASSAWEGIKSALSSAWSGIKSAASSAWEGLKSLISESWEKIKSAVSTGIDTVVTFFKELPGKIVSALGNLGSLLLQAGKDVIQGFINGVKAMASQAAAAVKTTIGNVVPGAKLVLDSHSPSRVFENIGADTIKGFVGGVLSQEGAAVNAVKGVMGAAINAAKGAVGGGLSPNVGSVGGALKGVQKTPINLIPGDTGGGLASEHSPGAAGTYGSGVNITMNGVTVREEADIHKIGAQTGFELMARPF
ncbi:phage tail protein [Planomonospora venezuelensis]|uniref:Phage-related protein n=1 Tax=Planomonospora venezuelensis TaxID=1999 RepID=A0A841D5A8_PLAVE|nr:hypothetical protein [Planomonospora venezuelensis]MBB5965050.1 phage-related protein [Planomonospora venezuelensis]GIN05033.1 hypothetical protein Pve01_66910 [Planomonospora venezuelensis]